MNNHINGIAAIILVTLGLGGCSFLQANPVPPAPPPAPEVAFARGVSNSYLTRQFERDSQQKIIGFKSLDRAQATVAKANNNPLAPKVAADELAQAQSNLAEALAIWTKIKSAPLSNPELLAQVDHQSYMASRWAEIALAESGVEVGLNDLAKIQRTLQRREDAERERLRTDNLFVGQQLVPEKFGSIRFALGTARLTDDSQGVVTRVAAFLAEHPRYNLEIAGHTDSSPPSKRNLQEFIERYPEIASQPESEQASTYNLDVSRQRAAALASALRDAGVAEERLSVRGFGQSQPIADNDSAEGRRRNRRVTATISSESVEDETVSDAQ